MSDPVCLFDDHVIRGVLDGNCTVFVSDQIMEEITKTPTCQSVKLVKLTTPPGVVMHSCWKFDIGEASAEQLEVTCSLIPEFLDIVHGAFGVKVKAGYMFLRGIRKFWEIPTDSHDTSSFTLIKHREIIGIEKLDGQLIVGTVFNKRLHVMTKSVMVSPLLINSLLPRLNNYRLLGEFISVQADFNVVTIEVSSPTFLPGIVGYDGRIVITTLRHASDTTRILTAVDLLKPSHYFHHLFPEVKTFVDASINDVQTFIDTSDSYKKKEGLVVIIDGTWRKLKTSWWKLVHLDIHERRESNMKFLLILLNVEATEYILKYAEETKQTWISKRFTLVRNSIALFENMKNKLIPIDKSLPLQLYNKVQTVEDMVTLNTTTLLNKLCKL
jgi:hypothetical protein